MKGVKTYICGICGAEYSDKRKCELCENFHKKPVDGGVGMSKAMLIMNMPKSCAKCRLSENGKICKYGNRLIIDIVEKGGILTQEHIGLSAKPDWCPLLEVPKKNNDRQYKDEYMTGYRDGYNACIDEILGG